MFTYDGRFCTLKELTVSDECILHDLIHQNIEEYRSLVSDESVPQEKEGFATYLRTRFNHGRVTQFLVFNKQGEVAGTIFLYGYRENPKSIKISCFLTKEARGRLLAGEALSQSLYFAVNILMVTEVHFGVYQNNTSMLRLAQKVGAINVGDINSTLNSDRKVQLYILKNDRLQKLSSLFCIK